ncbi:hypothetical protein N6C02_003341 [Vibrio fluvialis]|nr:hypothetical protein [Vibrio fluvialis]
MTYGKKDDDKTSAINGAPVLLPLEYCSIERASRMLRVEVEDIYHWCEIGAINLAVKLDDCICEALIHWKSNLNQHDKNLVAEIDKIDEGVNFSSSMGFVIGIGPYNIEHLQELSGLSICDMLAQGISLSYQAIADGFWFFNERKFAGESSLYPIDEMIVEPGEQEFTGATVRLISVDSDHIENKTHYILRRDIEKLYRAIYSDEALPNRYNSEDIRQQLKEQEVQEGKQRKPRTERAQSDMIKALLACLPDLNEELESNPSLAPNIMDSYLIRKELKPLNLGENNYRNWIAKAQYKP